jgi:hypothetical protein
MKGMIMNGKDLFKLLSEMPDEIKEQTEFLLLSTKEDNERLIREEAEYLASELETIDKVQAAEFGLAIKSNEFAIIQKRANSTALNTEDCWEVLSSSYEHALRIEIKDAMISKMREAGIEVPDGI